MKSMQAAPQPERMPLDVQKFASAYSQTNFLNAYYQIRDVLSYQPKRILIIGVGVGLEPIILRHKFKLDVSTLDIDNEFQPDYVGSVHQMDMFSSQQFDAVIASHVLEHLPFSYFPTCLKELCVAKHAVIYLPYAGRNLEWKFTWSQRYREYSIKLHIPPKGRISGQQRELQQGYHYWECGYPDFSVKTISSMIDKYFLIDCMYHNQDWKYSMNFRLTSRIMEQGGSSEKILAGTKNCA